MGGDELLRIKLLKTLLEWEEKQMADINVASVIDENMIRGIDHRLEKAQVKSIFSVIELSNYLGVSTDSIYTMVREKQIPHLRVRRRILFHRDAIDSWIQENTVKS